MHHLPKISLINSDFPTMENTHSSYLTCIIEQCQHSIFQQTIPNERYRSYRLHFNGHPLHLRTMHINNPFSTGFFTGIESGICPLCAKLSSLTLHWFRTGIFFKKSPVFQKNWTGLLDFFEKIKLCSIPKILAKKSGI